MRAEHRALIALILAVALGDATGSAARAQSRRTKDETETRKHDPVLVLTPPTAPGPTTLPQNNTMSHPYIAPFRTPGVVQERAVVSHAPKYVRERALPVLAPAVNQQIRFVQLLLAQERRTIQIGINLIQRQDILLGRMQRQLLALNGSGRQFQIIERQIAREGIQTIQLQNSINIDTQRAVANQMIINQAVAQLGVAARSDPSLLGAFLQVQQQAIFTSNLTSALAARPPFDRPSATPSR
jgi:hypothetical protein